MMDAQPIRAAIYTRVSTEDQAKEGFSLDAQLEKLRAYCIARDWSIGGEYVDDGYSGRFLKRPEYTRMMEDMDKWDTLLVIKMDRIHRNSKNFMLMMEHLKKTGKEFVSMTESLDTSTAMGRFVMDIIQRIAQLESEQIGERVYVGMEQKARTNGGVLGFNIPYGYDYLNGKLVVNNSEAIIIKNIFDMYKNKSSMKKIA
jgi:site-specific DNA recombinase